MPGAACRPIHPTPLAHPPGMTAVLPYAALNAVHTHPAGGPGLPVDDGLTEPDKKFNVRVMLPWWVVAWTAAG